MGTADGKVTDAQRALFVVSHDVAEQVEATLPADGSEDCGSDNGSDTGEEDSADATA